MRRSESTCVPPLELLGPLGMIRSHVRLHGWFRHVQLYSASHNSLRGTCGSIFPSRWASLVTFTMVTCSRSCWSGNFSARVPICLDRDMGVDVSLTVCCEWAGKHYNLSTDTLYREPVVDWI